MRSVKVQWVVGFNQKQWLSEEVFQNIIHIQTYNWKKRALCQSNKVTWVVGFKQKQWLSEEVFWNIIHMQTYNWTKYALCESTLSGGLQAEKMAFRRIFLKHYTHANIQLNKICALWKYTEWWASSRSNGFQKKFFKTLYTFKHTIQKSMRPVKVQWVMDFNQKQWLSEEAFQNIIHIPTYNWTKYALCGSTLTGGIQAEAMARIRNFSKHYTHSNIQLTKVCALWKYTDWWASIRSNCFRKKIFKTLYTFKHTIEQSMRSVKVQWVVGFKQKQGLPEEIFQNIIHIQTYKWKKCALCQSNKLTWVVGFKQKQWLPEEVFQNIIHIQTYNWTKYALCGSTLTGGIQAEAMARIGIF